MGCFVVLLVIALLMVVVEDFVEADAIFKCKEMCIVLSWICGFSRDKGMFNPMPWSQLKFKIKTIGKIQHTNVQGNTMQRS